MIAPMVDDTTASQSSQGPKAVLIGGANQQGVRAHNERLILSTLHHNGAMPGSEIARSTGLSPQTISVILRKLEADGLLLRGDSVRGRVGKPSVPMRINPEGLFTYGVKIGRRSTDLLLMDFTGGIRAQLQLRYDYPLPDQVVEFLKTGMAQIADTLEQDQIQRICGIGIGVPSEIWSWHRQLGAPVDAFRAWEQVDFSAEIGAFSNLQVYVVNDGTAACRAEHMFGTGKANRNYAYFFIGAFVGGGIVLGNAVFEGPQGNAGALGPLPVLGADGKLVQLLDTASIHVLEARLTAAGIDPARLWKTPQDWSGVDPYADQWVDDAATALARASLTICAVVDFEAIIVDGALPGAIRNRLVTAIADKIQHLDARGLILPAIAAGEIGANAKAIGAASGPIIAQHLLRSSDGLGAPA